MKVFSNDQGKIIVDGEGAIVDNIDSMGLDRQHVPLIEFHNFHIVRPDDSKMQNVRQIEQNNHLGNVVPKAGYGPKINSQQS